jgi:centriolar protein POC1
MSSLVNACTTISITPSTLLPSLLLFLSVTQCSVVNKVAFHMDGRTIAACSADHSLKLWDSRTHQLIQHYPAHNDSVTDMSLHPVSPTLSSLFDLTPNQSGNYILTSSKDSSMRIWDIREGRLIYTLHGHTGPTLAANFSQDGSFFASGGVDQLVMVWRSNLLGLGSEVTESFPLERCPRSFDEAESPRPQVAPKAKVNDQRPPCSRVDPTTRRPVTAPRGPRVTAPEKIHKNPQAPPQQSPQKIQTPPAPAPSLDREQIPPALVGMMDHIIGQVLRALSPYLTSYLPHCSWI